MKYSKRIVKRICDLISKDSYTIAEICATVGISERCYYEWQSENAQFAESIARAREKFDEILVREAKNSLRKLVNGYDVEEKTTIYVESSDKDVNGVNKPKIKEQKIVKKHFQPNPSSVEYVLNNKASDEYENRQTNKLTGKVGLDLFSKMSDTELDDRIKALEEKLKQKNQ